MGLIADIFALYLILLFFSFPSPNEAVATTGTVRLWRNGVTSRTYASGRVQVAGFFGSHRWANICGNRKQFDESAAEVICHQLGYSTALGFSKAAQDRFGKDPFPLVLLAQNCSASYLTIGQCLHVLNSSNCVKGVDDVSVVCTFRNIWSNPYDGMVRLVEGNYSSEGQLEVYYNGQWGTVCVNWQFEEATADVVCKQLGYTGFFSYSHKFNQRFKPTRIISNCTSSSTCLQSCGLCSLLCMPLQNCLTVVSLIKCENEGLPVQTTNSTCVMIDAVSAVTTVSASTSTGHNMTTAADQALPSTFVLVSASTILLSAGQVLTTSTELTVIASTILVNAGHVFIMATDRTVMISASTIRVSAGQAMVTDQTVTSVSTPTNNQGMVIDLTTTLAVTSVVSGGAIFFIVLIFTIILTAVFYRKKHQENVERLEAIYEPIDLPSIPPQLPPRQPRQISIQDNPSYVKVDLTDNLAYTSIKNETTFNSVSGALIVAVSHGEEKCGDDMTGGYEEIAESTELAETDDDQQSRYIELGTAEDLLPLPTTNPMLNMIVNDYDKLESAALLKSSLNPVCTAVSARNLTFDGVQEGKEIHRLGAVTLRNAHSATNIQSMGERPRFSSADNF